MKIAHVRISGKTQSLVLKQALYLAHSSAAHVAAAALMPGPVKGKDLQLQYNGRGWGKP